MLLRGRGSTADCIRSEVREANEYTAENGERGHVDESEIGQRTGDAQPASSVVRGGGNSTDPEQGRADMPPANRV